jgi:hypothetical protein
MRLTHSLALAAALTAAAGSAMAGGFAPVVPVPEPVVVVEPTAPRSTFGLILPLALLGGLVALAVASGDDDDDDDDNPGTTGGGDGGDD